MLKKYLKPKWLTPNRNKLPRAASFLLLAITSSAINVVSAAECTNLHDIFSANNSTVTINGIDITASRESGGKGEHHDDSGDEGDSSNYTLLYSEDDVDDNDKKIEDYIYHRITFSQAIAVGSAFTISDIDGNDDLVELGTIIGANNGTYVEPNFISIGSRLTQEEMDIDKKSIPEGINENGTLKDVPIFEGDDRNQSQGDADGSVTSDFGNDLVTDLYFIFAVKDKENDKRSYAIEDGCFETIPALFSANSDHGDAPTSGTAPDGTNTNNYQSAEHSIDSSIYLGSTAPDGESAHQSSPNADADDSTDSNDEDGVTLPTLTLGQSSTVTVAATGNNGYLQAWIDFDGNGEFDASEQVATNIQDGSTADTDGNADNAITFDINVPLSAVTNKTYARFRWSTDSGLDATTSATDGEVEDYALTIVEPPVDYGDAPTSYTTPKHIIANGVYLGSEEPDAETSHTASTNADSDDNTGDDDEDGVTLPTLTQRLTSTISVAATGTGGYLQAWIDLDGNGTFDASEQVASDIQDGGANDTDGIANNVITFNVAVPFDATLNQTYARFRWSTESGLDASSNASDGEVEDYALTIIEPDYDYGDADDNYGDARHIIVSSPTTYLGSIAPDADTTSQNFTNGGATGTGDDADGSDDEDALNSLHILYTTDAAYSINVPCTGTSTVAAWFDIDHSTSFDADERASATCSSGKATLNWSNLASLAEGITSMRIRTATNSADLADPTGTADDGEVEDYRLQIKRPNNQCDNPLEFTWNGAPNGAGTQTHWTNMNVPISVDMVSPVSGLTYTMTAALSDPDNSLDPGLTKTDGVYGTGYFTMFKSDSNGAQNDLGDGGAFTFSFNRPVYLSAWRVDDIDEFSNFHDIVEMTAFDANGDDVPLDMVAVGNGITQSGQTATAIIGAGNSSPSDAKAQASWTSNLAVNTLKLDYISGPGNLSPTTQAIRVPGFTYCEVEFDFGDAPSSYNDASHIYSDLPFIWLGNVAPDKNLNGPNISGSTASGDDNDGLDDEESVTSLAVLKDIDTSYSMTTNVTNLTGEQAYVVAWVDFDGNGKFDSDEAVTASVPNGTSGQAITLNWNVPADVKAGDSYVRIRLTTDSAIATGIAGTSSPDGAAINGEVEDYPLTIEVGGYAVSGRVYKDTNVNGASESTEAGVSSLPVVLMKVETDPANNTCISARTDGNGDYSFFPVIPGDYQLYEASRESVPAPQNCGASFAKDPDTYRSTTDNVISLFTVLDTAVSNQNFGDVNLPTFSPNNTGQILAGNVAFYAHKLDTPANGTVTFSNTPTGHVTAGWANILYQDLNCDGKLNGADVNNRISTSGTQTVVTVTAGNSICLINKVYAPANVAHNESQLQTITASFDYNNTVAGTIDITVTDLSTAAQIQAPTTQATPAQPATEATPVQPATEATSAQPATETTPAVEATPYIPEIAATPAQAAAPATEVTPQVGPSRLELRKTVQNITQNTAETDSLNEAKPGDELLYKVYYANTGTGPITDLVVNDNTPPYTELVFGSSDCDSTPSDLNCTPATLGDAVSWKFTGTLIGGASGTASYRVKVEE